ncbi:hypothetical protein NDU88_001963 [Pleurodeles waltl]|uniref:Uncharacterized protein n=1 Tax=Pleurodeles waltl TaxID=8319 RepID=A0AAV7KS92_PLEWA|nr:hypothetical protein NDU88_001963 [Pleurodeles waltl]
MVTRPYYASFYICLRFKVWGLSKAIHLPQLCGVTLLWLAYRGILTQDTTPPLLQKKGMEQPWHKKPALVRLAASQATCRRDAILAERSVLICLVGAGVRQVNINDVPLAS